jgi:hypothetical protein
MGERGSRRWRRALVGVSLVSVAALASCVVPPPGNPGPAPLRCASGPYDLGQGGIMEAIAPNGSAVVLGRLDDQVPGTFRYDLIDTRSGATWSMLNAPSQSDGADVEFDRTGARAVSVDYPASSTAQRPIRLHDRRTRTTSTTPATLVGFEFLAAVADDLSFAVVVGADWIDPAHTRVDLVTGARTPLPSHTSPDWWNADYSPDAALVVQTSGWGTERHVRVRSTLTGQVIRDFGVLTFESGSFTQLAFVDGDTVLIDGARLPTEGPGPVAGDEALLAEVSTGATTRIDPGVAGAAIEATNPDGSRLVYRTPAPGAELRVAVAGVSRTIGPSGPLRVEQDPVVLLTEQSAGNVLLHCV